jgi:hypothetical protein
MREKDVGVMIAPRGKASVSNTRAPVARRAAKETKLKKEFRLAQ